MFLQIEQLFSHIIRTRLTAFMLMLASANGSKRAECACRDN